MQVLNRVRKWVVEHAVEPEAKPMEVTSTDRGIDCNRNYSGKTKTRSKDGLPLGLDPSTVARISPGAG